MTYKQEQKVRVLEFLRITNPIFMFAILLFGLHWVVGLELVFAISIACLFAIIAFTVISIVLSVQRKRL